jgi:hypothetical protein
MPSFKVIAIGLVSYTGISVVVGLIVGKFIKGRPPQISNSTQSTHAAPDLTFAGGSPNTFDLRRRPWRRLPFHIQKHPD